MSKSNRLRAADIRAVYTLIGECRDLGDDPAHWARHLAAGVGTLTGAGVATVLELSTGATGCEGYADWGWETSGLDHGAWVRLLDAASRRGPFINPMLGRYMAALAADDGVALTCKDLVRDAEFYRSEYYQEYHRATGADAQLNCFRALPGGMIGVILVRPAGVKDFGPRHRAVVREAQALLAPLVGGPLAWFAEPLPSALPPRVRQVLRCLLEGDGDKQVAARLGISPHTVNVHTKTIFRHFGVQSRAELLARWVRRGWGGRRAWIDD